ncbi:hypothetical protein T12_14823 [Trichinella patagoniensis]|uniref:Uncharacterized protein n=1 Tax=Trichinella patagoniensis TaxID=990121 RepID=A0A0V0ZZK3_9BILA|nr:hypothetical protein T12_14823 [Trichinella patagoniensis]
MAHRQRHRHYRKIEIYLLESENLNIDINDKNKDEMGTIDLMLAKVREQLSSIYKQLEMDQGVGKAASSVWEFLKEKFASMINYPLFGHNIPTAQLPSYIFNSMYDRTKNACQYFKNRLSLPLKFINERLLNKLTDTDTDLQAKSLNISLDNLKEQSEKFYANVITPQVEENVMQRINSMWKQVYDEMSNVKTILSNKEQLSKALETLKANITDKSPESVKTIINELTKGGSSETEKILNVVNRQTKKQNLMNLISIAVGKRWAELMEHPEEIAKLLKMSN